MGINDASSSQMAEILAAHNEREAAKMQKELDSGKSLSLSGFLILSLSHFVSLSFCLFTVHPRM